MMDYAFRRLLATSPVLIGATIPIFLLVHLVPGDPAAALAGPKATQDPQAIRVRLGLDQPLLLQYFNYLGRVLTGDLGYSYYYKESINELIARTMPAILELSFVSLLISLLVSLPLGVFSATRRNSSSILKGNLKLVRAR